MAIKLDNRAIVESRLPIEPLIDKETKKLIHDGIPFVQLVRVEVVTTKHEKGEYKDLEVPELQFEFHNYKLTSDEPDRVLVHKEKAVHSKSSVNGTEDTIPIDIKTVDGLTTQQFNRIKHIYDAFRNSTSYVDFAKMTKADVDKYFTFPDGGTPEERISKFTQYYNYIADRFNGITANKDNPVPVYKNDNVYIVMRLKVVSEYKTGSYFVLPTYVKQGFIEIARKKDNMWLSPVTVYKQPTDVFTLVEGKSKSSILNELGDTPAATDSLLNSLGI